MRKFSSLLVLTLAILAICNSSHAKSRAVSLRALESAVKAGSSQQASSLCGITRMQGYVVDGKRRDIILFGEVSADYPALHLEDFVVALRNVELKYAERRGRTIYYSAPGCSIDPNPAVLHELQRINDSAPTTSDPEARQAFLEKWKAIGRSPQNVRVMGTPFYCRFAKVMVDADYYMKRLVNSSVDLDIPGFKGLMNTRMDISIKHLENGEEDTNPAQSMSRFWFCPGETTFTDDGGATQLTSCHVKLLTEEQFLTQNGGLAGYGRPDPLAQQFAVSFTQKYKQIGDARPIYKELEGLFRFVGIAHLLKDNGAYRQSGFKPGYLLAGYKVPTAPVSPQVPGLTNVKDFTQTKETGDGGYTTAYFCEMSCGGVSMDVKPKRVAPPKARSKPAVAERPRSQSAGTSPAVGAKPKTGSTTAGGTTQKAAKAAPSGGTVKKAVLESRKSSDALYWDVPKLD